jgi:response regulator NasT
VTPTDSLRILVANEHLDRFGLIVTAVESLGHEIVARTVSVTDVAATTARERPDVAIVGLGESSDHALGLVSEIVREAYCPVIVLLAEYDGDWLNEAAKRGVFAYIVESNTAELRSAIDITLRRFADVKSLRESLERRGVVVELERAATNARRRQALELHDGVVQGLAVAALAHDLGRNTESREALTEALERAKAIVSRSLDELALDGQSVRELIETAASGRADE